VNQDESLNSDPTPLSCEPGAPIAPAQPSVLNQIFIGKDGLRAGWSLLIFIALFAASAYCVHVIGHKLHPVDPNKTKSNQESSLKSGLIGESVPFFMVLLVTWIMSKIEHRPNGVYGFGGSRKLAFFFAGLGWGVICLSLLVLTLLKTGFLAIDHRLLSGGDIFRYGALWLLGFLLVGLLEEYLTRGYLQYTLTRGLDGLYRWAFRTYPRIVRHSQALAFWTSAIVFSILFGLGHNKNPGESPIGLLSAGLAAMVFCLSLWRTGSLWWAIGFHTAWDWSQSFLYGVADSGTMVQHHLLATHPLGRPILSGGATGPEGSIFILAIFGLICLIIFLTLKQSRSGEAEAPGQLA
jgi:uncharacterized protein